MVAKITNYNNKPNLSKTCTENTNPDTLKNNQYHIRKDYITSVIKLHKDSGTSLTSLEWDMKEYYNERVYMSVYLKRTSGASGFTLFPYYEHSKTTKDLTSVALSAVGAAADKSPITTIFTLATGVKTTVSTDWSGVEFKWRYTYK